MRLLPYDRFTLETQLDLATVVNRLSTVARRARVLRAFVPYAMGELVRQS